jgi:hypothetical protein
MKPRVSRAVPLAILLFAYSGGLGSKGAGAALLPQQDQQTQQAGQGPSSSGTSVSIPGPLRSFRRMAGISQKVAPEDVLPLLARNVVTHGFTWQEGGRRPTEFLLLLRRYVEHARALQALAGPEGVIRVSACNEAQPLLNTLGYRLSIPCGPRVALETADQKKAFITVDSGFPLAELEQTLQGGKPFAYPFPSTRAPVLFSQTDWTKNSKSRKNDVIDVLLQDPESARLYLALSQMDEGTRAALLRSPGLEKLAPDAATLDFYGNHICIRSNLVAVPGGTAAESAWKNLVGVGPDSPGEFVLRLVGRDAGWLAAYFDALSRINSAQQAYFAEPRRLTRFYAALRGRKASPGPAKGAFRTDPGLLLLVTRLWFEPNGEPHIPGGLGAWQGIPGRKTHSKAEAEWVQRSKGWKSPEDLVTGMFALTRQASDASPLRVFLTLNEIDRRRSLGERLSPQTVSLLVDDFPRFGGQYSIFSEFHALNDDSVGRFLAVADAINRIPDNGVRGDALGIYQAIVGLWEILARQGEIQDFNQSWQRVIKPFGSVSSSVQLFDATESSFGELLRAATGETQRSQDAIVTLLAGPRPTTPAGRQVRQLLADNIRAVLDAQRLISLDNLFALGHGLSQSAHGKPKVDTLLVLAGELREFELPKPLFTTGERLEWANGLYTTPHIKFELQMNLLPLIESLASASDLAAARGQLVPFLRDTLVGLNYAYYEPPGAQMLLTNPLFVRSHDPIGEKINGEYHSWQSPALIGVGDTASGGAHLSGSLADLPYALAEVEQNFIVPENLQALIWEDLVPSLLVGAVLPRWWGVTRSELHAVSLYQRAGEELLETAGKDERLRATVMTILSDRMLPHRAAEVEDALRRGEPEAAISKVAPAEIFYLAAEFRRRFPGQDSGPAGRELTELSGQHPAEVSWERLSRDFGVPHPALEKTYARELLSIKPLPTLMGYSSRLLGESWDSNNLYWARLADENRYSPEMLHLLVPELTHRMIEKISATDLEDWPALLRALRETGEEFRQGKIRTLAKSEPGPGA